jgi:hypothetical protein
MENLIFIGVLLVLFFGTVALLTREKNKKDG